MKARSHTFLIIAWNLISCAEFVIGSSIDSIWFHGNAVLFDIGKTKPDQEGTWNIDHPWHVYSNNECPYICPVLALARYLIDHPNILAGKCPLFEGLDKYACYNNILSGIVSSKEHKDTFVSLGMPPQQFGTHSIRKGAMTHISTGPTSCPPIASICLHANWAMPGVMNRYIKYENAGNQFVGKCVSGHARLSKKFAASLAYFDFSSCTRADKDQNAKRIDTWIKERMPVASQLNDKVFALFKMCIASIAHNRDFLLANLHSTSKLRVSVFLLDDIPLANYVKVVYPWNKTGCTPEITGIPPDVLILAEFEDMQNQFCDMQISITIHFEKTLKRELDDQELGGSAYAKMAKMMDKMDNMMNLIKEKQALPLPLNIENDVDEFVDGFELFEEDGNDIVLPLVDEGTIDQMVGQRTSKQLKAHHYTVGLHHGKLNPLPPNWTYPKGITLIQLINLWLLGGGKEQNVPPLGKLHRCCVFHFDTNARVYSTLKQVMMFVKDFGRKKYVWLTPMKTKGWNGKL